MLLPVVAVVILAAIGLIIMRSTNGQQASQRDSRTARLLWGASVALVAACISGFYGYHFISNYQSVNSDCPSSYSIYTYITLALGLTSIGLVIARGILRIKDRRKHAILALILLTLAFGAIVYWALLVSFLCFTF
jgi:hypothetical protein